MTKSDNLQGKFLELVKSRALQNQGFVDDLADLLCVSKDSAYRRIRGETPLQFDEIQKLCLTYNVSVDQLFGHDSTYVTFENRIIKSEKFTLLQYLKSVYEDLVALENYKEVEVTFAAKDIPPFHLFQYDKLTRFKLYFWKQNVEANPQLRNMRFSDFSGYEELIALTRSIWERYMRIPSVEIWSDETVNIALRHVFYYFDSGVLSRNEALEILEEMTEMLKHAQLQAERSSKFFIGKPESGLENTYKLFYNEVTISDNTIFYVLDGEKSTIITYGLLNLLRTSDQDFCGGIERHLKNVISKSSLISSVSERTRNKAFRKMFDKVSALRRTID